MSVIMTLLKYFLKKFVPLSYLAVTNPSADRRCSSMDILHSKIVVRHD